MPGSFEISLGGMYVRGQEILSLVFMYSETRLGTTLDYEITKFDLCF